MITEIMCRKFLFDEGTVYLHANSDTIILTLDDDANVIAEFYTDDATDVLFKKVSRFIERFEEAGRFIDMRDTLTEFVERESKKLLLANF